MYKVVPPEKHRDGKWNCQIGKSVYYVLSLYKSLSKAGNYATGKARI